MSEKNLHFIFLLLKAILMNKVLEIDGALILVLLYMIIVLAFELFLIRSWFSSLFFTSSTFFSFGGHIIFFLDYFNEILLLTNITQE